MFLRRLYPVECDLWASAETLICSTFLATKGVSNAQDTCSSRSGRARSVTCECRHSGVGAGGDDLGLAAERRLRQERDAFGQGLEQQGGRERERARAAVRDNGLGG